jgi:hypothetical protein
MIAMSSLRQLVRCTGEASRRMSTFLPSPKKLDDIMKLESLQDKQPEEIEALWMEVGPPVCRPSRLWLCPSSTSDRLNASSILTTLVAVPQRRHAEQGWVRDARRGVPDTAA